MQVLLTREMNFNTDEYADIELTQLKMFDYKRIVSKIFLKQYILTNNYNLIVLTSPAAIEIFKELHIDVPVICMSPFSANKLNGYNRYFLDEKPYNGDKLADFIINKFSETKNKICILSGRSGQEGLYYKLVQYFNHVKKIECYERIMPIYAEELIIKTLAVNYDVIVFTCNTAIENYLSYCMQHKIEVDLNMPLIVPSSRVGAFAIENKFTTIHYASSIDENDIWQEVLKVHGTKNKQIF